MKIILISHKLNANASYLTMQQFVNIIIHDIVRDRCKMIMNNLNFEFANIERKVFNNGKRTIFYESNSSISP